MFIWPFWPVHTALRLLVTPASEILGKTLPHNAFLHINRCLHPDLQPMSVRQIKFSKKRLGCLERACRQLSDPRSSPRDPLPGSPLCECQQIKNMSYKSSKRGRPLSSSPTNNSWTLMEYLELLGSLRRCCNSSVCFRSLVSSRHFLKLVSKACRCY